MRFIPPAGVFFPAPALVLVPPSSPGAVIRRSALAVVVDAPEFSLSGAIIVTHFRLPGAIYASDCGCRNYEAR